MAAYSSNEHISSSVRCSKWCRNVPTFPFLCVCTHHISPDLLAFATRAAVISGSVNHGDRKLWFTTLQYPWLSPHSLVVCSGSASPSSGAHPCGLLSLSQTHWAQVLMLQCQNDSRETIKAFSRTYKIFYILHQIFKHHFALVSV